MRKEFKFSQSLLPLLFLLPACAPTSKQNLNEDLTTAPGIIGGEKVLQNQDHPRSTVSIIYKEKSKPLNLCTGTVIDENVILTAAHCVPHDEVEYYVVGFNNQITGPFLEQYEGPGRVEAFRVHPDFEGADLVTSNSSDLALLRIKGPLPSDFDIQTLPKESFEIRDHESLEMLGYGNFVDRKQPTGL